MSQYDQAIENLNTYLQDDSKVHEINDTIFTALDVSNSGTVCPEDALLLTKQILLGLTLTDHDEFRQQQRAPSLLKSLVPNADGHYTRPQVFAFVRELLKDQIREMQEARAVQLARVRDVK